MNAVVIGKDHLLECPKCEGIWADTESLQRICADREEQAAVLGIPAALPANSSGINIAEKIHYVPCPICQKLMNRVNFAHCSNVIVDVCSQHGTWFDRDELRRIVEFIRAGGFIKAREREIEELEQRKAELKSAQTAGGFSPEAPRAAEFGAPSERFDVLGEAISAVAIVLQSFLRK
jgi:Zn-finger nucleic acid-binding protein